MAKRTEEEEPTAKPLVFLHGEIKTPPFSERRNRVDREKRKILEAKGYKVYDHAGDAVGMSDDEKELMDLRIKLAMAIRKQREKLALSQQALADRIKTSQPRVAKIEQAASDVSLDQIIRAYAAVGGKLDIKGVGIPGRGKVVKVTAKKKLKVAR